MDIKMDSTTIFGQNLPFTQVSKYLALKIVSYLSSEVNKALALTNKEWYALLKGRVFTLYQGVVLGRLDRYLLKTTLTHEDIRLLQKQTGIELVIPPGKPSLIDFKIGEGAFGELRLAITHKTGAYVALKITRGELVGQELIMQQTLSGLPGLLPLIDSAKAEETIYQIMPLGELDGRKLKKQLDTLTDPKFKLEICEHIAHALLKGLAGMHKMNAYHLDVKPDNLIITAKGECLLIDLGCGRISNSNLETLSCKEVGGDRRYLAPEVGGLIKQEENDKVFGSQIDGWAAGLTLLELASPQFDLSQEEGEVLLNMAILKGDRFFDKLVEKGIFQLENPEKDSYWELITELLHLNPERRLTPTEALNHPAARPASSGTVAFLCDFASNSRELIRQEKAFLNTVKQKRLSLKSKYSRKVIKSSLISSTKREESRSLDSLPYISPQHLPPTQFAIYIERLGPQRKLEELLLGSEEGLIAIHGIGGSGKTQLTTRLFHDEKIANHFGIRLWFRNASQANLLGLQYSALAREWYVVDEKATDEEAIEKVHQKLAREAETGKPWLIVFDNADTYESLKMSLPSKGGWVIVTTRFPGWEGAYSINTFTQEEGVALSTRLLQREDNHTTALCERVGNLPLALVQACAYIRNQKLSIEDYLVLLDHQPQKLLSQDQQLLGRKLPSAVTAVWYATFIVLKKGHPGALELLNNIAYLSNQLPLPLLNQLTDDRQVLNVLENYSLLQGHVDTYSVHRLVQETIRLGHTKEEQEGCLKRGMHALESIYDYDPKTLVARRLNHQLSYHGESVFHFYRNATIDVLKKEAANTLLWLGHVYQDLGNFRKVLPLAQESLQLAEELYDPKSSKVSICLNNLGSVWYALGGVKKAVGYYERALAIDMDIYGFKHPNVARGLNNLGEAWQTLGETSKAVMYFEQALEIDEVVYGPEHPNVARSLNNLGKAWQTLGDAKKAVQYHEKALVIDEVVYGPKHPNVARSLNNLGEAWQTLGDAKKAVQYHEKALEIEEAVYGPKHPNVAIRLSNLGEAWQTLGGATKAVDYYEKALEIEEAVYGPKHPNVAHCLNNLGSAWQTLGNATKAVDYYEGALEIEEAVYDPKHPNVANCLNNLGSAWQTLGEATKAVDYYERALEIEEAVYGPNHPHVARGLNNLGEAWRVLGKASKAVGYYEKALEIEKAVYGQNHHPSVATCLNNLGLAWQTLGETSKAVAYYEQALAIELVVYRSNHPSVATCLQNLGTAWQTLGETWKTVEYYERAILILEQTYGKEHPYTIQAARNLEHILKKSTFKHSQNQTDTFVKACIERKQETIAILLDSYSFDTDIQDGEGNPLITWIAQHAMISTMDKVLKLGWNPNLPNQQGIFPLHYAAMKSEDLTSLLIPYADPFVETPKGNTPAMIAKSKGTMDILKILIPSISGLSLEDASSFDASYNIWKKDFFAHPSHSLENRFKAFTLAFHFKDWEFAQKVAKQEMRSFIDQLIRQYPAAKTSLLKCIHPFTEACLKGDETFALKTIKAFSFEKDLCDGEGNSLICWVAQNTMTSTMEALLSLNWNPNFPNKNEIYPLHYAAMKSPYLTQLLLKAQANPFVRSPKGNTPAMIARSKGKMEALSLILPRIDNLNFENENAFHQSYQNYKTIFISYAYLSTRNILTNLELALHLNDFDFAKLVLKGCDVPFHIDKLIEQYPQFENEISILITAIEANAINSDFLKI